MTPQQFSRLLKANQETVKRLISRVCQSRQGAWQRTTSRRYTKNAGQITFPAFRQDLDKDQKPLSPSIEWLPLTQQTYELFNKDK